VTSLRPAWALPPRFIRPRTGGNRPASDTLCHRTSMKPAFADHNSHGSGPTRQMPRQRHCLPQPRMPSTDADPRRNPTLRQRFRCVPGPDAPSLERLAPLPLHRSLSSYSLVVDQSRTVRRLLQTIRTTSTIVGLSNPSARLHGVSLALGSPQVTSTNAFPRRRRSRYGLDPGARRVVSDVPTVSPSDRSPVECFPEPLPLEHPHVARSFRLKLVEPQPS